MAASMIAKYYRAETKVKLMSDDESQLFGLLEGVTRIEQVDEGLWQCWQGSRVIAYLWCSVVEV